MLRPKRTKVNPSQPASRRVAQRMPAEPSKRSNPVREASSRAGDSSDDSDGLATSFSCAGNRKSRPQLDDVAATMSGGLGFGDIKGAHIRAGTLTGLTESGGYAKTMEQVSIHLQVRIYLHLHLHYDADPRLRFGVY